MGLNGLVLYRLPIQLFMAFMASSSTSQVVNVICNKCSPISRVTKSNYKVAPSFKSHEIC